MGQFHRDSGSLKLFHISRPIHYHINGLVRSKGGFYGLFHCRLIPILESKAIIWEFSLHHFLDRLRPWVSFIGNHQRQFYFPRRGTAFFFRTICYFTPHAFCCVRRFPCISRLSISRTPASCQTPRQHSTAQQQTDYFLFHPFSSYFIIYVSRFIYPAAVIIF